MSIEKEFDIKEEGFQSDEEQQDVESKNTSSASAPTQTGGAKKTSKAIGSRAEVWHGTADHTSGGLKKSDLMKNKRGLIVSRAKHAIGQKMYKKNPELKEMSKKMKKKWSKRRSNKRSSSTRRNKAKRRPSKPMFF